MQNYVITKNHVLTFYTGLFLILVISNIIIVEKFKKEKLKNFAALNCVVGGILFLLFLLRNKLNLSNDIRLFVICSLFIIYLTVFLILFGNNKIPEMQQSDTLKFLVSLNIILVSVFCIFNYFEHKIKSLSSVINLQTSIRNNPEVVHSQQTGPQPVSALTTGVTTGATTGVTNVATTGATTEAPTEPTTVATNEPELGKNEGEGVVPLTVNTTGDVVPETPETPDNNCFLKAYELIRGLQLVAEENEDDFIKFQKKSNVEKVAGWLVGSGKSVSPSEFWKNQRFYLLKDAWFKESKECLKDAITKTADQNQRTQIRLELTNMLTEIMKSISKAQQREDFDQELGKTLLQNFQELLTINSSMIGK